MVEAHMVFDRNMNPAWCGDRIRTVKWLLHRLETRPVEARSYTVRAGYPYEMLSVSEYLRKYKKEYE
jgi:hypothetical protein